MDVMDEEDDSEESDSDSSDEEEEVAAVVASERSGGRPKRQSSSDARQRIRNFAEQYNAVHVRKRLHAAKEMNWAVVDLMGYHSLAGIGAERRKGITRTERESINTDTKEKE